MAKPKPQEEKQIVRLLRVDLDASKRVAHALLSIKGVSHNLARAVCRATGIDENKRMSELTEKELEKLEEAIQDPVKHGVPEFMVNRQKDYETGEYLHYTGADLDFRIREDINRLKKIKSYRGKRHEYGLPVRGQRTKSSFRKGPAVGVQRRKDAKRGIS